MENTPDFNLFDADKIDRTMLDKQNRSATPIGNKKYNKQFKQIHRIF